MVLPGSSDIGMDVGFYYLKHMQLNGRALSGLAMCHQGATWHMSCGLPVSISSTWAVMWDRHQSGYMLQIAHGNRHNWVLLSMVVL